MIKYTNNNKYSLSVAAWLIDDDYDYNPIEGPYLSVTDLLNPIRIIILKQRANKLINEGEVNKTIDIDSMIPSRLGSSVHAGIEYTWAKNKAKPKQFKRNLLKLGYPEDIVKRIKVNPTSEELKTNSNIIPVYMEQRSYKKIGKWTIGGKYDFVGNGTIEDFKSMAVYGFIKEDKTPKQIMQCSLYRWLNPDIVTQSFARIQHIFTDWNKLDARIRAKSGYPQSRILDVVIKLKPIEEMQTWVENILKEIESYQNVPETELPLCTELWQDKTKYKYYKKPEAKRATRVFDDPTEAYEYMKTKGGGVGEVKEIKGLVRRCNYCPGADICSQRQEIYNQGLLQEI